MPDKPDLLKQWDEALMSYLSDPGDSQEKKLAYLEIDRKCRKAGLLPPIPKHAP